jgi:thiol-disulfide isomerase/thioredoxin
MSRYKEWLKLQEKQTEKSFDAFWEKYCDAEKKIYSEILKTPDAPVEGTFAELVQKYDVDPVLFMGFLDGINTSVEKEIEDLDAVDDETAISLKIDVPKLYYNMQAADADHLYTLPEWDDLLPEDERDEIVKAYKRSRTVRVEKKPGRNEPCPCGSGKKYKRCCGAVSG